MPIPFFFLVKFTENHFKEFSFPENAMSSGRVALRASYLMYTGTVRLSIRVHWYSKNCFLRK